MVKKKPGKKRVRRIKRRRQTFNNNNNIIIKNIINTAPKKRVYRRRKKTKNIKNGVMLSNRDNVRGPAELLYSRMRPYEPPKKNSFTITLPNFTNLDNNKTVPLLEAPKENNKTIPLLEAPEEKKQIEYDEKKLLTYKPSKNFSSYTPSENTLLSSDDEPLFVSSGSSPSEEDSVDEVNAKEMLDPEKMAISNLRAYEDGTLTKTQIKYIAGEYLKETFNLFENKGLFGENIIHYDTRRQDEKREIIRDLITGNLRNFPK